MCFPNSKKVKKFEPSLTMISVFLVALIFGLFVVNYFSVNDLPFGISSLSDEGVWTLSYFVLTLFIITALFFIIIRLNKMVIWSYLYFISISIATAISLYIFFGNMAVIVALLFSFLKMKSKDVYIHNISEILIYGGVASVVVKMFNPVTAFLLIIIISFYDLFSVYISKHMIKMINAQIFEGIRPGILIENNGNGSFIGGGDIAFTLVFAGVFISNPLTSLTIICGACTGLFYLLASARKGKYYPAMPLISFGAILGLAVSSALF